MLKPMEYDNPALKTPPPNTNDDEPKKVVFDMGCDLPAIDLEQGRKGGVVTPPTKGKPIKLSSSYLLNDDSARKSPSSNPGTPTPSPCVREQSKRFSKLLMQQTELHSLMLNNNQEQQQQTIAQEEEESAGLRYWLNEMETAHQHGGDYQPRSWAALRAALGSFAVFSVLVFPHQQVLGAVWIGNIFFHTNLKDNLGASITSVQQFAVSIVATSVVSLPISVFLASLSLLHGAVLLPFITFFLTFFIMSCPQLAGRNLMILVMYIIIATVVREEIEWWQPLGWTATYLAGLGISVLMNIFPKPNMALHTFHVKLSRLEKDFTMLLKQSKHFAENASSTDLHESRAAIASIEMLHSRVTSNVKLMKIKLPSALTEINMTCRQSAAADLAEWVNQAEKLLAPLKSLRTGLTQRVLGEEYQIQSPALRQAKGIINAEVAASRDRLVDAMIASIAVCHAWADPSARRVVLPDVHEELDSALKDCKRRFHRAMAKAAAILHHASNNNNNTEVSSLEQEKNSSMTLFAHLTRRMAAFHGIFELAESLSQYLNRHNWEAQEIKSLGPFQPCQFVCSSYFALMSWIEKPWLWRNPDSLRLALKTSVGMLLASLFISIPYLWDIASPFGVWPGLTIASVNLADSGSSFHKAGDRLFGTLLAAAFSLLVTDLFPGNSDYVKIPAISIFTFGVIYLKDSDHAYKFTYAATSIGSMLYGSVKNDFNIAGYIPKRIELIFTGIVIFTFVELFLFPRSSRRMVEKLSLKFFSILEDYTRQATICAQRMKTFIADSSQHTDYVEALLGDNEDPFQLQKLSAVHKEMKSLSAKLKKELKSGLDEPNIGMSAPLNSKAFRGLSTEIEVCEVQAILILKAFKELAKHYRKEDHPLRRTAWPEMHAGILQDVSRVSSSCYEKLAVAYPDGRLRPQAGNAVRAVIAASGLREFQDVRLRALSGWTDIYSTVIESNKTDKGEQKAVDPVSVMTISMSTTLILDLCRAIQNAGKHAEDIAHSFPPTT